MNLDSLTLIPQQAVIMSTPLLLAGFGELVAERAGVINIGIEGLMLMGCIASFGAAAVAGTAWAGIPAAIAVGMFFAALFAVVTIWFRADQIVTGTAINILAMGASTTAAKLLKDLPESASMFGIVPIPWLDQIPILGPTLFRQYGLFYFVVIFGIALYLLMRFSKLGLIIRALGDAPEACDAAGIRVRWWRTGCVLFAGGCAGLAGAYLATMRVHKFTVNMTDGQGFLVLALVIFGRWNIGGFVAGTLLFGLFEGLRSFLTTIPNVNAYVPHHQLFDMLPYLVTLAALAILSRSRSGPVHLGRPWPPTEPVA